MRLLHPGRVCGNMGGYILQTKKLSVLSSLRDQSSRRSPLATISFRINTYRRISKQRTSTPPESHSYKKHRGRGLIVNQTSVEDVCPEERSDDLEEERDRSQGCAGPRGRTLERRLNALSVAGWGHIRIKAL